MKCIYLLLLVTLSQAYPSSKSRTTRSTSIPAPRIKLIRTLASSYEVHWVPVEHDDQNDPILGYKLKIWVIPHKTILLNMTVDGVTKQVKHLEEIDVDENTLFEKPKEIIVLGSNNTWAVMKEYQMDTFYRNRVLAFTKTRESPLSNTITVSRLSQNSK